MRIRIVVMHCVLALLAWASLARAEALSLGIPLPLTGPQAKFGEIARRSYEIAAEEINARGGVAGRQLLLHFNDSRGLPDISRAIAEKLVTEDKQPVLLGEYSSSCSMAVARAAGGLKVPYLVVAAAADDITRQHNRYVYRLCPPNSCYVAGLMPFIREVVKPKTMAILYESSDFGASGAQNMRTSAEAAGIRIVLDEPYEAQATDLTPLLERVKAASPDVVYMVSYVLDGARLMRQMKDMHIRTRLFAAGAAGFALPQFIEFAGEAAQYVVTVSLWTPHLPYQGASEFAHAYRTLYGNDPSYHGAEAYAALYVIKDVLERSASMHPDDINAAMKATNLETAFGVVVFQDKDGYQNQNFMETYVLQILNGRHETVWPERIASARYVFPVPSWR